MTAYTPRWIFGTLTLGLVMSCGGEPADATVTDRLYLLERVGDTAIVQLYADGFEDLSLKDKILCYHLANAAIAGRDIFIDQKFRYSLPIRNVLEQLYVRKDQLELATAEEIERYTKLFWVHNGIHSSISTYKELLRLDWEELAAAAETAGRTGAKMPPEDMLREMHAVMTDPDTFASVTNKSPGEGLDPVAASSNNLYVNVTTADLDGFAEQNPLNSQLVKNADGTLEEKVYRAGNNAIPAGLYAPQLGQVIEHFSKAMPFAPENTQKALELLIRYYETGDFADWHAFNVAWVQDTDSVVDQINGFVEVYLDARGQKGAWEAVVSFVRETTRMMEDLAEEAQWFEDRMPWEDRFKKEDVKGITARAITVIIETGDSGPISPIGINLTNELDIREDHGSKSVNLSNVVEAYDRASAGGSAGEFAWTTEEMERARKYGGLSDDVHTNLHEVVGHASGKVLPEVGTNAADMLGTYASALEEGRADLIALYWISDPKLQEMGIIPHPDAALAQMEGYARNALVQLRRVPEGGQIEEDHMRNRQMIIHWLLDNSDAVVREQRDGKTFYRVTSAEAFREGCGELLAESMRIKATGDFEAGKALIDNYGIAVDPELRQEVVDRLADLNLPSATGFVQPELRAITDASGAITDVEVHYPKDIAAQMLRWSGTRR